MRVICIQIEAEETIFQKFVSWMHWKLKPNCCKQSCLICSNEWRLAKDLVFSSGRVLQLSMILIYRWYNLITFWCWMEIWYRKWWNLEQYHPDMGGGAEDKFKEISAAYEVLRFTISSFSSSVMLHCHFSLHFRISVFLLASVFSKRYDFFSFILSSCSDLTVVFWTSRVYCIWCIHAPFFIHILMKHFCRSYQMTGKGLYMIVLVKLVYRENMIPRPWVHQG